jgi:type IV secretion system protein VirB9
MIFYHNLIAKPIFLLFFFCSCLAVNKVYATQLPRYLGSEKKFRSYIYNPNETYRYFGHYNYQGIIEFDKGETATTISMGDPTLWLIETSGNRLFLKPVGEKNSETNMTVITAKRIYHFELMAKEAKGINDKDLIFIVKFSYPEDENKNIVEFPKVQAIEEPDLRDMSKFNFNYQYTGERAIAPSKIFDDGDFTYMQFADKRTELPAIYAVDSKGYESPINYRINRDYYIIEKIVPQLTLRSGTDIVCVYNLNTYTTGKEKISTLKANQKFNPFTPKTVQPKDPTLQLQRENQNTLNNNANIGTSYDQNNMPLDPTGFNNLPNNNKIKY